MFLSYMLYLIELLYPYIYNTFILQGIFLTLYKCILFPCAIFRFSSTTSIQQVLLISDNRVH